MIPQSPALAYAYFRLWELFFIFFFTNGNFPAILFKNHKDAPVVQLDRASDSGSECWGFESLRAYQARIDRKVYPSFFLFQPCASIANQASSTGLAFLGRDPQRENVPQAPFPRFGFGRTKARIDRKVYPSFFLFHPRASIANQASSTGLAFLGRDPQRENVPQAPFPRFGFGRTKNRQVPQGACRFLLIHYSLFTLH